MTDDPAAQVSYHWLDIDEDTRIEVRVVIDEDGRVAHTSSAGVWCGNLMSPASVSRRFQQVEAEWVRLGALLERLRAMEGG